MGTCRPHHRPGRACCHPLRTFARKRCPSGKCTSHGPAVPRPNPPPHLLLQRSVFSSGAMGVPSEACFHQGRWGVPSEAYFHQGRWGVPSEACFHQGRRGVPSEACFHQGRWGVPSEACFHQGRWGVPSEACFHQGRWWCGKPASGGINCRYAREVHTPHRTVPAC